MQTFTTTERYAAAHGLDVTEVRALARKGLISGAIRVGGPRSSWAIPVDAVTLTDVSQRSADTAARGSEDSRAAADTRPNRADSPKVISTGDTPAQIARRVESRVRPLLGITRETPPPIKYQQQSIPPAYTRHVGEQLIAHLTERNAA